MSGHVDGQGHLQGRETRSNAIVLSFGIPEALARYLIVKGSVAVDGISLTINDCDLSSFQVSIIPQTAKITTIGLKPVGAPVNIETDIIGKYVERFTMGRKTAKEPARSGVDVDLLARTGFLDH